MAKDTNGSQMAPDNSGTEVKVPILSGYVSKRETIEALTENARTGKLNTSFRTIVRKIGVLVPGFEPGSKE